MVTNNPISALDALLAAPRRFGALTAYPLTIQRIAVLELLESPLVNARKKHWELFDVIAALWTMISSPLELRNVDSSTIEKIKLRVWQWASHNNKALKSESTNLIDDILRQTKLLAYLVPEFANNENAVTSGKLSSNGWLAQTAYVSAAEFGFPLQQLIEEIPISQLMLLRRQKHYNDSEGKAITLEDKEQMDRIDKMLLERTRAKDGK